MPRMRSLPARIALTVTAAAVLAPGRADDDLARVKERELEAVRERIGALEQRMEQANADRDRITRELEEFERAIARQRRLLEDIEAERQRTARRLEALAADMARREAELERESRELAAQVRAAYMSGGQERLKLMLQQENPASLGRLLAWFDYLNRRRADNIEAVKDRLEGLAALNDELLVQRARRQQLAERHRRQLATLNAAEERRRGLLAELDARLADESREIERLTAEAQTLERLVHELTTILADYPIRSESPFAELRGKLTWPVAGRLLHDYGQPRSGGIRWNGVVLAAARGSEVRAVYHGRVVFADWLAGMGLLIIVDHGDDYLTLYGYNETLLANPGDWLAPGDVIATVGDSGGQSASGLYFELRHATRPINPHTWVTRTPGSR